MADQPDPGANPSKPPQPQPQPCAYEVPAPKGDDGPLPEKDDEQA